MRYVHWLWWGRLGGIVSLLQLIGAAYLTFFIVKNASYGSNNCYTAGDLGQWHRHFFLALALVAWLLTIMQCCSGSNVLAWGSLYARHSEAWRAYYHEMFDYGIREALCCLGRARYINPLDEDDVDSVAAVLGDLVSYRAAGASHLEFLAGLALLQLQRPCQSLADQFPPAPESLIREATILHQYAVAAYTGPLLDVGRNPLIFPCVWLYRQGVLTPWNRNRRPLLEGDNWWRGHAAAFLRHLKLPPEALRQGRVYQAKRECAYFVTVVHRLQCVIVAVRGTETPEDLLTDGLGRECMLMESDLHGLLQSENISESLKQHLQSTEPHFGHKGITEAARELVLQLDNISEHEIESGSSGSNKNGLSMSTDSKADLAKQRGLLSSLLGPGGECEGYALRFVGHSLGGSIAALTAIRLYARYPQLHVYGYGVLPCLDATTADTCSSFVTSIVYNDEFSSRLSVSSVKRLRMSAVRALASEASSDSGTITRLARQLLGTDQSADIISNARVDDINFTQEVMVMGGQNRHKHRRYKFRLKGRDSDFGRTPEESEVLVMTSETGRHGQLSETMQSTPEGICEPQHLPNREAHEVWESMRQEKSIDGFDSLSDGQRNSETYLESDEKSHSEMFMPGLIIHLVPANSEKLPLWQGWSRKEQQRCQHQAVIKDRKSFQDIVVSPSMFLDHMPWRCQYALNSVLEHITPTAHVTNEWLDVV